MSTAKPNYSYFDYCLPSEIVEDYIARALQLLHELKNNFPEFYSSFRCPSEVLTLSGVRAFDTYYELGKNVARARIHGLKTMLRSYGLVLLEENFPFGNEMFPNNRYSMVHIGALSELPNRYRHMPGPDWNEPDFSKLTHDSDFFLWWATWQRSLLFSSDTDATCKQWLANSSGMAHDITFGMLLGYPGEAICSNLYLTEANEMAGQVMNSSVNQDDAFDGAYPRYRYLRGLAENVNIHKHQELWSSILDGVYSRLEK